MYIFCNIFSPLPAYNISNHTNFIRLQNENKTVSTAAKNVKSRIQKADNSAKVIDISGFDWYYSIADLCLHDVYEGRCEFG